MPAKKSKKAPEAVAVPEVYAGAPLRDLFMLCRAYGVLRFEGSIPGTPNMVKFDLAPMLASEPETVAPSTPQVPESQPDAGVKREPKRGKDGLTAEEQDELLGRVMDAER
mgnify:CR=1 FL=1